MIEHLLMHETFHSILSVGVGMGSTGLELLEQGKCEGGLVLPGAVWEDSWSSTIKSRPRQGLSLRKAFLTEADNVQRHKGKKAVKRKPQIIQYGQSGKLWKANEAGGRPEPVLGKKFICSERRGWASGNTSLPWEGSPLCSYDSQRVSWPSRKN